MATVNFTMLTHSRPKHTFQALSSLSPDSNIKVLVRCDRFLDEGMRDVLDAWSQKNAIPQRVVYYTTKLAGTGEARNDVIATSKQVYGQCDYLYLSDDDVFFFPHALEKMIPIYEYAKQIGFAVLGAYNHPYHIPVADFQMPGPGNEAIRIQQVQALALQSMLMSWDVWDAYGPFVETPVGKVRMSEDVAFTNKITQAGLKIGVISPALVVNTGLTDSFGEKIPGWEMVAKQVPYGVFAE